MVSWQVRDKMERQGAQVKKLEANHAHLISRNNFKVLIFQVSQRSEVRTHLHLIQKCSRAEREPGKTVAGLFPVLRVCGFQQVTLFGEEWLQELNWNVCGEQMELFCSRLKVSFPQPQKVERDSVSHNT